MLCNKQGRRFLLLFTFLILGSLCGCSNKSQSQEQITGFAITQPDEVTVEYPIKKYIERVRSDRTSLEECRQSYSEEIELLKAGDYKNIHFADCEFQAFPDTEEMEVLVGQEHGISVQESWDTIQNWLENLGQADTIDMKKEVKVVSPQLGTDANDEYYPFYEHMSELNTGAGAFLTTKSCHIQITANGIYSMSTGKITEYLGLDTRAHLDAFGDNCGEEIEAGSLDELENQKYPLISGDLTVGQGAEMVKAYYEKGTPFPCEEGVTVDISRASVFHLGDVNGYRYMLRRKYKDVPFAWMDEGSYRFYGNYIAASDSKRAFVVDDTGVAAYSGANEAERLISLAEGDEILGVEILGDYLSENLASQLNIQVETVGLSYFPVQFQDFENTEEKVIFPCWEVTGVNRIKEESVWLYVDVFTGDIYYYTAERE